MLTHLARARARLIVAVVAVVIGVVAGITATAQAPAAETACGDGVVVLGARGSGETSSQGQGLGNPGFYAYSKLSSTLRDLRLQGRVRFQTVDYRAAGVGTLLDPLNPKRGLDNYFASISEGVENARTQLGQIVTGFNASGSRCDGPRIVFLGYSQGAMVMHRLLRQLAPGGSDPDPDLLSRIGGAILIGDGDKQVGDTTNIYGGNTANTRGIGQQARSQAITGTDPAPLPAAVRDRTYQICANLDFVCDAPSPQFFAAAVAGAYIPIFGAVPYFAYAARAAAGVGVHVNAYNGPPATTLSGDDRGITRLAIELSKTIPSQTPTTTTPPTTPPTTTTSPTTTTPVPSTQCQIANGRSIGPQGGPRYMPVGQLDTPYDKVWRIPELEGCPGGWGFVVEQAQTSLAAFGMNPPEPIADSDGIVRSYRITGTPRLATWLANGGRPDVLSGLVRIRSYLTPQRDVGPGKNDGGFVVWGVRNPDGTYNSNPGDSTVGDGDSQAGR